MNSVAMIGICPVCNQGRLLIAREKKTGVVYIGCEDCESEWKDPNEAFQPELATRNQFGESDYLSLDEAAQHPWNEFVK